MHILEQCFLRRNAQARHVFVATFSPLVLVIVDGSFSLQFDSARICSQLTQMCRLFMNDSLAQKLTNFPGSLEQQQKIVKLHSNLNILSLDESTFHFHISKKSRNNKQQTKSQIFHFAKLQLCNLSIGKHNSPQTLLVLPKAHLLSQLHNEQICALCQSPPDNMQICTNAVRSLVPSAPPL